MIDLSESLLCKGMRDLLPPEMARFRRVEQAFRDACAGWGYAEIRTPSLEHLYLFTSTGTLSPQLLGRVYSFLDWDGWTGERVVLRPDATIPVARLHRERLRQPLAKLAYVENIFRFSTSDEPREIWQCGAELVGDSWPYGDLELIAMALQIVRGLGIHDVVLQLSHTGVVRSLLDQAGFAPAEQVELYDRLLDGDRDVVGDIEARLPELGTALRLLTGIQEGGSGFIANLRSAFLPAAPAMQGPLDELDLIARSVGAGSARLEISATGVRDFEYYTGPVFTLSSDGAVLASGGRYDRLIGGDGGEALPACGFALHVDRLLSLLPAPPAARPSFVRVVPAAVAPEALTSAIQVAEDLQAQGIGAGLVERDGAGQWRLQVAESEGRSRFVLTDHQGNERMAASIAQVVTAIRGG